MYTVVSIHTPHLEHRNALIDSMHRFGAAMQGLDGLIGVHTLEDTRTGRLVGLAMFESEEAAHELLPLARAAVKDDAFDVWEAQEIDGLRLVEA
jgi:hypothetical protein